MLAMSIAPHVRLPHALMNTFFREYVATEEQLGLAVR